MPPHQASGRVLLNICQLSAPRSVASPDPRKNLRGSIPSAKAGKNAGHGKRHSLSGRASDCRHTAAACRSPCRQHRPYHTGYRQPQRRQKRLAISSRLRAAGNRDVEIAPCKNMGDVMPKTLDMKRLIKPQLLMNQRDRLRRLRSRISRAGSPRQQMNK